MATLQTVCWPTRLRRCLLLFSFKARGCKHVFVIRTVHKRFQHPLCCSLIVAYEHACLLSNVVYSNGICAWERCRGTGRARALLSVLGGRGGEKGHGQMLSKVYKVTVLKPSRFTCASPFFSLIVGLFFGLCDPACHCCALQMLNKNVRIKAKMRPARVRVPSCSFFCEMPRACESLCRRPCWTDVPHAQM